MMNFAPWDQMLRDYVNDRGRVDYARWQQESAQELDQWLAANREVDIEALDRESAIAFLINLYNALTIQQVLQKYPIDSIRPSFLGIPNWLAFLRFFIKKRYVLKGQPLSLNAIEHTILRERFQEPRIHFALVCASEGCPLLRSGAYWPDQLNQQLEEDANRFINNPEKVHYEPSSQILHCSKIFKWYQEDFLTVADSIQTYISRYLMDAKLSPTIPVDYLPYSWRLNQRTSS